MLKTNLSPGLWKLAKFLKLAGQPYYRRALRYGVRAAVEHESVLTNSQFKTVVDIGANRGQFALAARKCLPGASIVSFEPLADAAKVFNKIFEGDDNVTLHQVAIGQNKEQALIHVTGKDYSSSLLPITELQTDLYPGTSVQAQETIQVERLSNCISPNEMAQPALLKLDVQGFELQAIQGCMDLLPRFACIYAECCLLELYEGQALAAEIIAFLSEKGFHLGGVYNIDYDQSGTAIQGDFLFRPSRNVIVGKNQE